MIRSSSKPALSPNATRIGGGKTKETAKKESVESTSKNEETSSSDELDRTAPRGRLIDVARQGNDQDAAGAESKTKLSAHEQQDAQAAIASARLRSARPPAAQSSTGETPAPQGEQAADDKQAPKDKASPKPPPPSLFGSAKGLGGMGGLGGLFDPESQRPKTLTDPPAAAVSGLSAEQQTQLSSLLKKDGDPIGQRNYENVVSSDGFKKLGAAQQTQVLQNLVTAPRAGVVHGKTRELLESTNFQGMSAADQGRTLDLMSTFAKDQEPKVSGPLAGAFGGLGGKPRRGLFGSPSRGLGGGGATDPSKQPGKNNFLGPSHLVDLVNRDVNGKPALLDRDSKGKTLLDNLHGLNSARLPESITSKGMTNASLLADTLEDTALPHNIHQSTKGTCTVTSMQRALADNNPSEYARVMSGLVTSDDGVAMRNGDKLTRAPASEDRPGVGFMGGGDTRSDSERLMQSALMDYGNGDTHSYVNRVDANLKPVPKDAPEGTVSEGFRGLHPEGQERVMDALFTDHDTVKVSDYALPPGTNPLAALADGRLTEARDKHVDGMMKQLEARNGDETLVNLKWGDNNSAFGSHAVNVVGVKDGRVLFENPWGPRGDPNGTTYTNPPRRMENNDRGLESMSVEDFRAALEQTFIPAR
jgi:hypothetical protein